MSNFVLDIYLILWTHHVFSCCYIQADIFLTNATCTALLWLDLDNLKKLSFYDKYATNDVLAEFKQLNDTLSLAFETGAIKHK